MFDFFNNPQSLLHGSSRVLAIGLVTFLAGIYGAYLYHGHLPIAALVSMHAMTIIGPTLLKIGYVMRLLAQHRLTTHLVAVVA